MPAAKNTKLVMFHCPEDVRAEMDALCEHNMIDRTAFLLQAIDKLMDCMERQQEQARAEAVAAYPELEDMVLLAAEESEDEEL